jgi:hypothetical protein
VLMVSLLAFMAFIRAPIMEDSGWLVWGPHGGRITPFLGAPTRVSCLCLLMALACGLRHGS